MKASIRKFVFLGLALCLPLGAVRLLGQTVLSGAGGIDLVGGSDFTPSAQSGAATRFLWLPGKGALVLGRQLSTPNVAVIGNSSVAIGVNASATGTGAIAIGESTVAGDTYTVAIGKGVAHGVNSTAVGRASADGQGTTALGDGAMVNGIHSFAAAGGDVTGDYSIALGGGVVIAERSIAIGQFSYVEGNRSTAIGLYTSAMADESIALGILNAGKRKDGTDPQPGTPSPADPIFEVGNGTISPQVNRNAFTVFRDGTVRLSKASGGIAMGQFQ